MKTVQFLGVAHVPGGRAEDPEPTLDPSRTVTHYVTEARIYRDLIMEIWPLVGPAELTHILGE